MCNYQHFSRNAATVNSQGRKNILHLRRPGST
jgi:hypothetical protein